MVGLDRREKFNRFIKGMGLKKVLLAFILACVPLVEVLAQCTGADILEPGFAFITSSRGCAPFNVQLQTLYLSSVAGTE